MREKEANRDYIHPCSAADEYVKYSIPEHLNTISQYFECHPPTLDVYLDKR